MTRFRKERMNKYKIISYLISANLQGEITIPIIRDLLERSEGIIDIEELNKLDKEMALAVTRAYRYCTRPESATQLLILADVCRKKGIYQEIAHEIIHTFTTLSRYSKQDLENMKNSLFKEEDDVELIEKELKVALLEMKYRRIADETIDKSKEIKKLISNLNINGNGIYICQISDIHFGIHHAYSKEIFGGQEYVGPTQNLGSFLRNKDKIPDYYLFCGDIASSKTEDFDYFKKFAENLPTKGRNIYDCMLVVPGNHDNLWEKNKTDKLRNFKEKIADKGFRTPFGINSKNCITKDYEGCPVSAYIYEENKIIFLLLTSCYYTGEINPTIKEIMDSKNIDIDKISDDLLLQRMRYENGVMHGRYINIIEEIVKECVEKVKKDNYEEYIKISVIHHHIDPFFDEEKSILEKGIPLKMLLNNYGFNAILHGHVHKTKKIHANPNKQIPIIASPSLSGKCSDSGNGINILKFMNQIGLKDAYNYRYYEGTFNDEKRTNLIDY